MTTVRVEAGARDLSYSVLVEAGLRKQLGAIVSDLAVARRWVVISDATVTQYHADSALDSLRSAGLEVHLVTFPAGEASKSRKEWGRISDLLLDLGLGRDSGVLGLGGGVTGDLAGFVAATYMRGLPVVQVPTSLLAMIDASVGGKTGVNTGAGKNLIGAFHAPAVVVVDPEFTETLPRRVRAEGLAEAIKHGVIRDAAYLLALEQDAEQLLDGDVAATERAVTTSVAIKADVVSSDEREAGLRKILNFGHTLGHGIEAASKYSTPHGHAVSIGMVAEARMGEALGVTDPGTAQRIVDAARLFELPVEAPDGLDPERVGAAIQADKKGVNQTPEWVPVSRIGSAGTTDGRLTLQIDGDSALSAIFGGGEEPLPT